ncbi:MAG: PEP-CTERM sorting domain-containing protein [Planctomycetota bacterium]
MAGGLMTALLGTTAAAELVFIHADSEGDLTARVVGRSYGIASYRVGNLPGETDHYSPGSFAPIAGQAAVGFDFLQDTVFFSGETDAEGAGVGASLLLGQSHVADLGVYLPLVSDENTLTFAFEMVPLGGRTPSIIQPIVIRNQHVAGVDLRVVDDDGQALLDLNGAPINGGVQPGVGFGVYNEFDPSPEGDVFTSYMLLYHRVNSEWVLVEEYLAVGRERVELPGLSPGSYSIESHQFTEMSGVDPVLWGGSSVGFTVVPEPGTLAILGLGGLGLLRRRR